MARVPAQTALKDHERPSPAKVQSNPEHHSAFLRVHNPACAQKMFDVPRLIQIRDDDVSGLFLGVNKPVVADIKADVIRCHAVR